MAQNTRPDDPITWSKQFLKTSGRLPTDSELSQKFGPQITRDAVWQQIKDHPDVKNPELLEDLQKEAQPETGEEPASQGKSHKGGGSHSANPLGHVSNREKDRERANKAAEAAQSRGRETASGVLASVDTALENHNQEIETQLTLDLKEQAQQALSTLGIKIKDKKLLEEITARVAKNATVETLDELPKVQDLSQINQVVADNLTQALMNNDALAADFSNRDSGTTYQKVFEQTKAFTDKNIGSLQKTAVLGNIAQTLAVNPADPEITNIVNSNIDTAIAVEAPVMTPAQQVQLNREVQTYLTNYKTALSRQLASADQQTPTLAQLGEIKDSVANQIAGQGKSPVPEVNFTKLATAISAPLGMTSAKTVQEASQKPQFQKPTKQTIRRSFPQIAFSSAFNFERGQQEANFALLLHNKTKFDNSLASSSKIIKDLSEKLKEKKSLSYKEKQLYKQESEKLKVLQSAKALKPKRVQAYLKFFQSFEDVSLAEASHDAWSFHESLYGRYNTLGPPKSVMLSNRFGKLGFLGPFGALKMGAHMGGSSAIGLGHGMGTGMAFTSPQGLIAGKTMGWMKKLFQGLGATFGGLFFLMLGLGQAALAGFLVGAGIGGLAGAIYGGYLGFEVGLALAPFTFGISIPVFTLLGAGIGFFAGGIIGGLAGALIMYGLSSGSTTAVAVGAGAAIGGVVGAAVGASAGAAVGLFICLGFAPCGVIGAFFGATAGAFVGAVVGGAIGYGIGQLIGAIGVQASAVLGAGIFGMFFGGPLIALSYMGAAWLMTGGFSTIKDFLTGTTSTATGATTGAISGLGGSILGGFASAASTVWGAATTLAGGAWGAFTGAAGGIVNGISSIASAAVSSTAAVGTVVGGTFAGVAALGATVLITQDVAFSTTEAEVSKVTAGNNQYFTITKTADKNHFENSSLPQDLTFTITLTAKQTKLTSISVTDEMTVQVKSGTAPVVTNDKDGKPFSPITDCQNDLNPNTVCTYHFTITVNSAFADSSIVNTVKVRATPEGQKAIEDSTTAVVTVGTPPANCPQGWPTTGYITQGPEGHFLINGIPSGHADIAGGLEAIDIGAPIGTDVYATIDGTAHIPPRPPDSSDLDQILDVTPNGCPKLSTVRYQHLSRIDVADGSKIVARQKIGKTGDAGTGPHMHYQFNTGGNRTFKLETPNVPKTISPRTCNSRSECATDTNAQ